MNYESEEEFEMGPCPFELVVSQYTPQNTQRNVFGVEAPGHFMHGFGPVFPLVCYPKIHCRMRGTGEKNRGSNTALYGNAK